MIEVEAKFRIRDVNYFKKEVSRIAKYVGKERKVDDYYTLQKFKGYPKKSLRVRNHNGKWEINFKQRLSYKDGIYAKKETEFNVKDVSRFIKLISDFGFRKWLRKEKVTELYKIKKNFHIEINHVFGLGWFLEIEYLAEENEIRYAKKEVGRILSLLEIDKKELVKEGYTKLLWDRIN